MSPLLETFGFASARGWRVSTFLNNYFLLTIGGSGAEEFRSVASDLLGNIYGVGYTTTSGAGAQDYFLVKFDKLGNVVWQKAIGGSSNDYSFWVDVDSSQNVYICGQSASTGIGGNNSFVAKFNSSGVIQWQKALSLSADDYFSALVLDSSSNVHIIGAKASSGFPYDALIMKLDTSGTILWQTLLDDTSSLVGENIALDSSGNVYISATSGASNEDIIIAKYNNAGTIQWQRRLAGSAADQSRGISVDSSGNIYAGGWTTSNGAGGADAYLCKYNNAGTIQWQRTLGDSTNNYAEGHYSDLNGNSYLTGYTDGNGGDCYIAKYNNAGTIQWQRKLSSSGFEQGWAVTVNVYGDVVVAGTTSASGAGGNDSLIAVFPTDGSKTGSYILGGVSYSYQASAFTDSAASLTSSTSSFTSGATSGTFATTTFTNTSTTFTSNKVVI